ncbi:MAG: ABC transporter permease [Candidatus Sumerlaeaceae bacterium]|nr:ABC transporter permease [Candidatus Sumerlaeaceae bacterium]
MRLIHTFVAVVYKEFITVLRDRTTLFFMFFPPLIQIIAFGFALDNDVKHMRTIILDEDRSSDSRAFVDALVSTNTFRVVGEATSVSGLASAMRAGDALVGIQIPPDFSRRLRAGGNAQLQVLIDGSNSTPALQAMNTAMGLAFRQSLGILLRQTGRDAIPLEVRPQVLYNPSLKSPNFFVPGVIGMALQIATVFSTALALVRERERGTLEQLLTCPISRWGLMLGKIVPYLLIALLMATSLYVIMVGVFGIPIAGSMSGLAVATFVYVFALLSLGLLVSTMAENHMQAFQMTMVLMLPSIFFSGFIFPRDTMPAIFYAISTILPATYFIELVRAIILRGAHFSEYSHHLIILSGLGMLLFTACSARFRRTLG